MRLRDAVPADLAVIAGLIRALADYERLADEVVWADEELEGSLFGPGAVPRVVLAELDGWTRYRWVRDGEFRMSSAVYPAGSTP